jgi:hypothetical protein
VSSFSSGGWSADAPGGSTGRYEPPPPFAPPEARAEPLTTDQAMALLYPPPPEVSPPAPHVVGAPRTPWALIGGAVVVVGVVLAWALVMLTRVGAQDGTQTRVSLPDVAGDYQLVRAVDGHAVAGILARQLGSLGALDAALSTAQVGVYRLGPTGPTNLVFLGFNAADSTQIDDLLNGSSAQEITDQVMVGAGASSPASLDPGPFGGALQCAAGGPGQPYTPCVWADRSTLGLVLQVGAVDVSRAGDTTRVFRAAAEH